MLSRVAAVKAPRTHNRRRVTGSSGRRREGRESERQRPNMSRHVFTFAVLLLLVAVMMCCGSGGAQAGVEEPSSDPNFEWNGISEGKGDVTVESFGIPGLLNVGSGVFAVAEARCKKNDGEDTFTGIASQLLRIKDDNEPMEVLKDAKDKTQFLEKCHSTSAKKRVDVSRPTTVVKESDIYMLVGQYSRTAVAGARESDADEWGLLLVKGEVSGEEESNKQIDWKDTNAVPKTPLGEQLSSLTRLIGGGGSGVKLKDGTLVFPLEGTKKDDEIEEDGKTKTISLVLYLQDTNSWKLSKGMSADGCSDPSVVEWEKEGKLMMMTACDDGRRRVYESGDKGNTWTEAVGTLSHVWGNKKRDGEGKAVRSGFITATFGTGDDGKNVMLVTLPVYAKEKQKEKERGELHLWLTDNTHIVDIGPVSGKDDDVAASSLLYKSGDDNNDELVALYEKKKGSGGKPSPGMVSVRLTAQLERVKEVLATWKEVDEHVSKLCSSSSAAQTPSPDNACSAAIPTDGLVGFLSGNFSDGTWRDEYLGVNATVKKGAEEGASAAVAEKAESSDGVKFTGRGAWAEWPVGSQGENQLYHFANYNFTLVATVSIDGEPTKEGPISLMGAKMKDAENPVLLGLLYRNNNEKKWMLLCDGRENKGLSSPWQPGKKHQLAIVLQSGSQISAYVDGQPVGGDEQCALETTESKVISHFYIGGDGSNAGGAGSEEEVSVTVTNVLLYNRPLTSAEIGALNPNKAPIPPAVPGIVQGALLQSPDGQPLSDLKLLNEDEGVGGGSASTSAVSASTTSSGKEQSANQLSSGIFSGGNKNVDGGSSSNDDQTVGAEAGDTVPGDGPPQTPADTPATADANIPTAETVGHDGPALTTDVSVSSGADGETAGGTDGQEEQIHPQDRDVNATALSSSLGNLSQGNNSDAGTVRERRALPLLLLLLGLWGFAAL
ncbi:putative trans-sialidase [Trypanosoma cruzi]|nr:putative trans-sialidase [Trypanosoma cruzi]